MATAKCEDKVLNDELGEVATYLYHIMKGFPGSDRPFNPVGEKIEETMESPWRMLNRDGHHLTCCTWIALATMDSMRVLCVHLCSCVGEG